MKRLCKIFLKTFIISALATELIVLAAVKLSLSLPTGKSGDVAIYTLFVLIVMTFEFRRGKMPPLPKRRLNAVIEKEGYTPRLYRVVREWQKKCGKKGFVNSPAIVLAELLTEGGYYSEAFAQLAALDPKKLTRKEKNAYYNTYLYGAAVCGDKEAADKIYESGRPYLITVTDRSCAPSVKHTLGCYEYLKGNVLRAEELFMQSLGGAVGDDLKCGCNLGLCVCYLDTGRLAQAKKAVETAALSACSADLKEKLERAKRLVEMSFAEAIKNE